MTAAIPRLISGPRPPIAQMPMKPSWKSTALSQKFTGRSLISSPCRGISSGPMPENPSFGPVSSSLCRSESTDGTVCPDNGYHPCHHEDRAGQYRLQHAPLSVPGVDQYDRIATQRGNIPTRIKTQRKSDPNNHQAKRHNSEIRSSKKVLRSPHFAAHGKTCIVNCKQEDAGK